MRAIFLALAAASWPLAVVHAQSNVDPGTHPVNDPANKFCWDEGSGWINWRDAEAGAAGARLYPRFLAGYLWCESTGWIKLGGQLPQNCNQYPEAASQSGPAAFGVNLTPDPPVNPTRLLLSGYAWSESTGWINFGGGALATPPQPAYIEPTTVPLNGRLRGYAWSEGSGWINLNVTMPGQYVQFCYANCDGGEGNPGLTGNDFQCFLDRFAAGDPYANCDGSSVPPCLNANDFQCFIDHFAAGCT